MKKSFMITAALAASVEGFSFMPPSTTRAHLYSQSSSPSVVAVSRCSSSSSSLKMLDSNVIQGGAIAVASFIAGIGLVTFTENQGERSKERGGGLSDTMATQIAGKLMEDIEVSSVSDMGSLTSQLENALKASGGVDDEQAKALEMTEAEKQRIAEEAEDGW
uniref:Uncharacterized protein n=1 Tax=Eucampia antarctica TaxID=49252 RepID=A0A7S2W4T6_9STRA|mmetsp:Transcript_20119/g.19357  ORF Transcript_20119/g.19357 Transcript_20119/m.19357 type:complete len:162 (+) Transcript_20119:84-569(+)|eukprot:CAMPEP_0197834690 /NCGR_PEP_ID=MMETSP1437-20131217/23323_1 /TAXON_ID=49252 ORGANISM="Eucampia antarctica, Strain CCMP1452" /NCGR_SAMPLE_ID=MMETSP1437 /ASSEMBLY_ACC=CAM_ASM_001096 /LENGTH=161 /DNA_ID=CAMNT_0043439583 /DNA_START=64 /DNA_END=549 /DNA_ORIENTATION=-